MVMIKYCCAVACSFDSCRAVIGDESGVCRTRWVLLTLPRECQSYSHIWKLSASIHQPIALVICALAFPLETNGQTKWFRNKHYGRRHHPLLCPAKAFCQWLSHWPQTRYASKTSTCQCLIAQVAHAVDGHWRECPMFEDEINQRYG